MQFLVADKARALDPGSLVAQRRLHEPRNRMPIEANEPLALAPAHERREALHGNK